MRNLYIKNAKIIIIIDISIETGTSFFSIIFFIAVPKLPNRKAIIKNLDPLVRRETITK